MIILSTYSHSLTWSESEWPEITASWRSFSHLISAHRFRKSECGSVYLLESFLLCHRWRHVLGKPTVACHQGIQRGDRWSGCVLGAVDLMVELESKCLHFCEGPQVNQSKQEGLFETLLQVLHGLTIEVWSLPFCVVWVEFEIHEYIGQLFLVGFSVLQAFLSIDEHDIKVLSQSGIETRNDRSTALSWLGTKAKQNKKHAWWSCQETGRSYKEFKR